MIDLRSDTVTKPTPAMRRAMIEAEVGDDVYGEDPTVNRLEERAAEIAGKEAALFVPTGTMGNTIAIKLHTEHGQEVICDSRAHVLDYELSMMAWFCGCLIRAIPTERRHSLRRDEIAASIRPVEPVLARPPAWSRSRTPTIWPAERSTPAQTVRDLRRRARARREGPHGWRPHLQRVAGLGLPVREIAAHADTVMFCLSKALGAPVGSMLAGPADLIAKGASTASAWAAACGRSASWPQPAWWRSKSRPRSWWRIMPTRASWPKGLARIPGIQVDPAGVDTNIVVFDISATGLAPADVSAQLSRRGVLINAINQRCLRAVTHYDVDRAQCAQALEAVSESLAATVTAAKTS